MQFKKEMMATNEVVSTKEIKYVPSIGKTAFFLNRPYKMCMHKDKGFFL